MSNGTASSTALPGGAASGSLAQSCTPSNQQNSEPAGLTLDQAEELECLQAVLGGDVQRFSLLVDRYRDAVLHTVWPFVRDRHRAEDLAQEAFVLAFGALKQLREHERFLPWLLQIARNRAMREMQRRRHQPELPINERIEENAAIGQAEAARQERIAEVLGCVERLPEPYRTTIVEKYSLGKSCKQIADNEGVPLGTISSRLTRALVMLRQELGAFAPTSRQLARAHNASSKAIS